MPPRLALITVALPTALAVAVGCEARDRAAAPTAAALEIDPAAPGRSHRPTIERMYEEYRREAFPDLAECTAEQLRGRLDDATVIVVDCREDRERAVSMIPDAISRTEFEANADAYRDRTVVTYCTIGYRSGVLGVELRDDAFDVLNLRGGVLAWAHAGETFVDADGQPTRRAHVYGSTWDLLPEGYTGVH